MAKTDDDPLVTRNRAAEILGRDRRTVRRALVDVVPDRKPARWHLSTVAKSLARHGETTAAWNHHGNGAAEGDGALTRARARLAEEKARLAQLEREEREGRLVPTDQVEMAQAQIAAVVKAHVLAIPTRALPELMHSRTPQAMLAILTRWCRGALEAISETEIEILPPMPADDSGFVPWG